VNDVDRRAALDREESVDLLMIWRVVWRRKLVIALTALAFGIVAAIYSLVLTPQFRAQVVIADVREGNMGGMASLASQFGGLASLAGVNLGSLGNNGPQERGVLESRRLVSEFIARNALVPVLLPKGGRNATPWMAAERFRNTVLLIHEDKLKSLTTLSVQWTDPVVAAQWANGLVSLANELLRARALEESTRNIAYLNEQIARTNVVELRKVLYDLIETETKTQMIANGRREYAFAVVDPAVPPEERYSPKRTLIVLFAIAFGVMVGVLGAFAHDRLSAERGRVAQGHA
jgi:uncharacterized protein involved in exopolysaccharide biosynthesis